MVYTAESSSLSSTTASSSAAARSTTAAALLDEDDNPFRIYHCNTQYKHNNNRYKRYSSTISSLTSASSNSDHFNNNNNTNDNINNNNQNHNNSTNNDDPCDLCLNSIATGDCLDFFSLLFYNDNKKTTTIFEAPNQNNDINNLTMGGGHSKASSKLTPQQEDLKFLGNHFPFGDAELHLLYDVYNLIQDHQKDDSTYSFLQNLARYCLQTSHQRQFKTQSTRKIVQTVITGPPSEELLAQMKERVDLIRTVEEQILPDEFGSRLYQAVFADNTNSDDSSRSRLECFFRGLAVTSRRGARAAVQAMFDTCQSYESKAVEGQNPLEKSSSSSSKRIRAAELVDMGYRIALAASYLQANDDESRNQYIPTLAKLATSDNIELHPTLNALANSILERARRRYQRSGMPGCMTNPHPDIENEGTVELEDVLDWSDAVAPVFGSILPTFSHLILFPEIPMPNVRTSFDMPAVPVGSSTFFESPTSPLLFSFGCLSPSLSGHYHRLYTSDADGLSFNRLQNAVLGYSGPTLIIIRAAHYHPDSIFGAFTSSQWKESKDFYGNTDCFLYQISPCTAIYRPSGNGKNYMYCNSTARSRGYDQQAHGIGFGGTTDEPRLFLQEGFDHNVAASQDMTFENGHLLPTVLQQQLAAAASGSSSTSSSPPPSSAKNTHFDIDSLEVWGVGGSDVVDAALDSREKQRDMASEAIRRARKVDKAQFLDDLRSGVIDSKAFQHRQQIDGRADADVDDRFNENRKNMNL